MLPKRFEIDSKCNSISRNASKKASKMWLHLQYASNKGQTITIKCFYSSLTKQSPISQLHSIALNDENAKL